MESAVLSRLYFLADRYIHPVDKLEGRYFVWAEEQKLRTGQTLLFTQRDVSCEILKITLILGKKIEADTIENGHKYFLDFDRSIGPVLEGCYLDFEIKE